MNLPRTTYLVILVGALAWCLALILPALLVNTPSSWMNDFIYRFFHPICHQLPERSFHLFGEKLAVCSRCSSIYAGFLFCLIMYPFVRRLSDTTIPHRNMLLIALLPMVVDVGLDFVGIHPSTFLTRAITGCLFGIVAPFFLLPAGIEAVQQVGTNKSLTIVEH